MNGKRNGIKRGQASFPSSTSPPPLANRKDACPLLFAYVLNNAMKHYDPNGNDVRDRNGGKSVTSDLIHDEEGMSLLNHWLDGGGKEVTIPSSNNLWHSYMTDINDDTSPFRTEVKAALIKD